MKNKKGFTLVELLVVIAIIGILSSVAIVNLNSAREKARAASVQAALSQISSAAILCMDDESLLTTDGAAVCTAIAGTPIPGSFVCADSTAEWPTLPTGWVYENNCASIYIPPTSWNFTACEGAAAGTCTVDKKGVDCDETGCTIVTK